MPSTSSKLEILIAAKDEASGPIGQIEGSLKGLDSAAGSVAGGLAGLAGAAGIAGIAALGTAAAGAVVEMAKGAAEAERLGTAFETLAQKAGTSGESILSAMKKASQGTVSDVDLMASANRAMLLGVADSAGEMAQLMDVAAARGKAMGESTGQAFSDLVTGIGRMSPMILDNLGITLDAVKVNKEYAATLGKTADQLTEAEKKQALLNAVVSSSTDLVNANKAAGGDAASNFERMDAAISNAKDSLGALFGPAVAVVAQSIADAATSATQALAEVGKQTNLPAVTQAADEARASLEGLEQTLATQSALLADMKANGEESSLAYQDLAQAAASTQGQINDAHAAMAAYGDALDKTTTSSYDLWIAQQNANMAAQQAAIDARNAASAAGDHAVAVGMLADKLKELKAQSDAAGAGLASIGSSAVSALQSAMEKAIPAMGVVAATKAFEEQKQKILEEIKVMDQFGLTLDEIRARSVALTAAAVAPFEAAAKAADEASKAIFNMGLEARAAFEQFNLAMGLSRDIQSQIDSAAKGAGTLFAQHQGGDIGLNKQKAVTDELKGQVQVWKEAGYTQKQIDDVLLPGMVQQLNAADNAVFSTARHTRELSDEAKAAKKEFQDILGVTQSVLQGALDPGVGVDPQKALEKMGIPRADAINENARRLADIAQNGLKNQDWLGSFQQEVPDIWKMIRLAQNPQEEAARLLQDFQDGLLTSPIDKDKAKEIVRRQIMGDQNMADLANEIATELATEMGVPLQEAMAATQKTLGGGAGMGTEAASQFADGAAAALDSADGGGNFVSKFSDQMRTAYPLLAQAGKDAGKMWGSAFLAVVGDSVPPQLISILTDLITPAVVSRLAQRGTLTGATP